MDDVARVREKIDIVSLISEYIPLKKMGRNFKALCPFHTEKTPSFVVSPERQIWHCFGGCGKGGDCFTFLMEYEKLEFVEALRILSKKAGIELRESNFQTGLSSKKEKIYLSNRLASEFYHYALTKHPAGEKALSYLLNERKIDRRLIETFMLGFSPKDGNSLSNYLINKKGYKKEDLVDAGLAFYVGGPSTRASSEPQPNSSGRTQAFDFFRNRIMFPLFDHRNNIVGFSGRLLEESSTAGKYINTRETLVYHKGSMFFGLNMAKDEIKNKDRVIVTEGEFDVISMNSYGIKNVVAIKGTALTDNQARLLSRFTQNISLCFDSDSAGYEATKRSLAVLEEKGFSIAAIVISNGKDADEAIKNDPFEFKKAVREGGVVYDYIFDRTFKLFNKNSIDGKRQISNELLPIIHNIENEIVKEHYLKKLSVRLDTSYESLIKQLEKVEKKEVIGQDRTIAKIDKRSRREILEEYLLALIIQYENSNLVLDKAVKILKDYTFETPSYKKILDFLTLYFSKNDQFPAAMPSSRQWRAGDDKKFVKDFPLELAKTFDTCFLFPMPRFLNSKKNEEEIENVARELRVIFLRDKINLRTYDLKNEEKAKNSKEIEALGKEVSMLIHLLSQS